MVTNWFNKYFSFYKEVSIAPLVVFRIIFGALMLFGTSRFLLKGWVETLYVQPDYYFGYLGFEWIKPLPDIWMYLPFILMLFAAIGIILGAAYRLSAAIFFICFTYIELLDKTNYLNHYYFVSLMSFLMIWVPANRCFSIDVWLNPHKRTTSVYAWHIGIIKFQLAVVYIFAGIAKINYDWLFEAQPLKIWLQAHHNIPIVGDLLQNEITAYFFSWFGCIYDLFIVFFLLSFRWRKYAYFFVIVFHIVTWYLFPIGVFPWVMIFSTLVFFSAKFHLNIIRGLKRILPTKDYPSTSHFSFKKSKIVRYFFIVFIAIQILIPFRYLLYPGNLYWNEEGFRFSWRVMLMHKEGHATFYLKDPVSGRESEINNANFLTVSQEDQMATQPDMILQYAQILYNHYKGKQLHYGDQKFTIAEPEIHAEIYVSLNGRPSQLFVNKQHNLVKLPYDLKHRNWIEPFQQ